MAETKQNNTATSSGNALVYPYNSVSKSVDIAKVVSDLGGANSDVQRSLIAQAMKMDEGSNTLTVILGAAKLYDLVDGRGTYRLTETAKQYFHPANDSDTQLARLRMIKSPPLFGALIERFDGTKIPAQEMLVNLLHREYRVAESWRIRAASMFLAALKFGEVIDSVGFLRFRAAMDAATNGSGKATNLSKDDFSAERKASDPPADNHFARKPQIESPNLSETVNTWSFGMGEEAVRLQTSRNLSAELWEKLDQYVKVLKPSGGVGGKK